MNLKTEIGRKSAIEEIETSFIQSLRKIGVELSDEAVVSVRESMITLGIKAIGREKERGMWIAIASDVDLFAKQKDDMFGARPNKINFGASGSFDNTQRECYWRTIHAASILKNWEKVCESVNQHCQRYSDLVKEIQKQNQ